MPINSLLYPSNVFVPTTFDVDNSVRMDGSSKFTRSFGSAGNRKKWTMSMWVKRGALSADQKLMGKYTSSSDRFALLFNGSDQLQIFWGNSGGNKQITTNRLFRDTSAFYNFTFIIDTGNSTESDRMQIWVNGVRETSMASTAYPTSGQDLPWNDSGVNEIGSYNNSNKFSGYLAEVVHQNDNAATPVDKFISFDEDTGICVPIDVSGLTLGTNGFYLDFEDSSALGNDASGSNNFTSAGLAATDQGLDTCTNNFATLNSIVKSAATLSEGNLKQAGAGKSSVATIGVTSGKWYFEQKFIGSGVNEATLGFALEGSGIFTNDVGGNTVRGTGYVTLYVYDGKIYNEGTATSSFATFAVNDIIGWNLDADAGDIFLYRNGSILNSGNAVVSGKTGKTWFPFGNFDTGDVTGVEHNFGGARTFSISSAVTDGNGFGAFEFAPKSGHLAICTKNLAGNS